MSLLEDLKEWYKHESYPPDGPDLDYVEKDGAFVKGETETTLVTSEDLGDQRWGTTFQNVYKRDDEFVAITDVRPATEMQGWGDYGDPDIYRVTPRTETIVVTKYERT